MHEAGVAWRLQGVGLAVAISRIDECPAPRSARAGPREILPHSDRAEAFVQENQDGIRWPGTVHKLIFNAMPLNRDEAQDMQYSLWFAVLSRIVPSASSYWAAQPVKYYCANCAN